MKKYIQRLKNIDSLIQTQSTGSPKELAKKMNMSERMIYRYLHNLRGLGAPISYNYEKRSYMYTDNVFLKVAFEYQSKDQQATAPVGHTATAPMM